MNRLLLILSVCAIFWMPIDAQASKPPYPAHPQQPAIAAISTGVAILMTLELAWDLLLPMSAFALIWHYFDLPFPTEI